MKLNKLLIIATTMTLSQVHAGGLSTDLSTLGAGLELSQNITKHLSIKLSANDLSVSIPYGSNINMGLSSVGLIVSYAFFRGLALDVGAYKVSGGLSEDITASASMYGIGGTLNQHNQLTTNGINPYVGLSYTSNTDKGFFFGGQVGVIPMDTTLTTSTNAHYNVMGRGGDYVIPTTTSTTKIFYPVIGLKIGYNFN